MAHHRHKREPNARPRAGLTGSRIAAGVAVVATLPAVAVGVFVADPQARALVQADRSTELHASGTDLAPRRAAPPVSRSFDRAAQRRFQHGMDEARATARAVQHAESERWTTTRLNLWSSASGAARQVGQLGTAQRVLVTGRAASGRVELVVDGRSRWATAGYLAARKPRKPRPSTTATATARSTTSGAIGAAAGLSMVPCPNPSVENGLTSGAVYVYRSVCHAFPQITTYGGWSPSGEHASGQAIDIMTSDVALGTAIANFLQAHAAELNLYDVIWRQHIWTPVRASEGWRFMPDRGSVTANHFDHVHVSVY